MKIKKLKTMLRSIKTCSHQDLAILGEVISELEKDEENLRRQQYNSLKKRIEK